MGWIVDKVKDTFSAVGSFVKRGLKKVGKFFKRAFKKVGKFMGRLGPVGMLGMMLIMPQLGAWWSEFGAWAGKLAQPFKFVMEGVHWAGAQIGKAYSTITEGIDNLIGGFAETVGLGDKYTDLKSWMDTKMNEVRDFAGLETTAPITTTGLEDKIPTDADIDYAKIEPASSARSFDPTDQYSLNPKGFEGLDISQFKTTQDVVDFRSKMVELGKTPTTAQDEFLDQIHGGLGGKEGSLLDKPSGDKWYDKAYGKAKKIYGTVEGGKEILTELGLIDEGEGMDDWGYQSYVADNYVPLYNAANSDWNQQGFQGAPQSGIGNPNYLISVLSSFENNPYYLWMANNYQSQRRV
jgi:hypothetical protein